METSSKKGMTRREFMRNLTIGATGAALSTSAVSALAAAPAAASAALQEETLFRVAERSIRFKVDYWRMLGERLVAAHPEMNLKVQVEELDFGANYDQAVLTNLAGGTPHDLFWVVDVENYHFFASKGVIQPLDPFIERDGYDISPFLPTVINFFTWPEEGLHLLPTGIHNGPLCFFFNKTWFDEAGLPYPTLETTTAEAMEMAKQLADVANNKFGIGIAVDWLEMQITFARSFGGDILSDDGTTSRVLAPETIAAYQYLRDLTVEQGVNPKPAVFEDGTWEGFQSGLIAMLVDGPWRIAPAPGLLTDFEWDMTLMPAGPAGRHGQLVQEGYPMAKDSKNQDLAWEYVQLMSSKEEGIARPALGFISAAREDSILAPELMTDPRYAIYAQDMVDNTSRTPTLPANYRIKELFNNIADFTSPIWLGEVSVEDGLTELDFAVQEILAQPPP